MFPEETQKPSEPNVSLDKTNYEKHILPDETVKETCVLLDRMEHNKQMLLDKTDKGQHALSEETTSVDVDTMLEPTNPSSDAYPDTIATTASLPELIDSNDVTLSNVSATERNATLLNLENTLQPTDLSDGTGELPEQSPVETDSAPSDVSTITGPMKMVQW